MLIVSTNLVNMLQSESFETKNKKSDLPLRENLRPIKLCCISVIPSYILSALFMDFIYKLSILYKRELNGHTNIILFYNQ